MARKYARIFVRGHYLYVLKCEEFSESEAREKLRRDILYIKLSIMALGDVFYRFF